MTEEYGKFASVYDLLMQDVPYAAWARYLAGIDPEFDDSADLALEPTFGTSLVEDPKEKK